MILLGNLVLLGKYAKATIYFIDTELGIKIQNTLSYTKHSLYYNHIFYKIKTGF